jgi:hypothetical protein
MKRISLAASSLLLCTQLMAQTGSGPPLPGSGKQARPVIAPGSMRLEKSERSALAGLRKGGRINLPSLDRFTGNLDEPLEFQRMEVFAPGARIYLVRDSGTVPVQARRRHFFLASNSTTGMGIAIDLQTGKASG